MSEETAISEVERFILHVYNLHKIHAGEMLPVGIFMAELLKERKISEEEFKAGLMSLVQKGMVKEVHGRYFLTELGQETMRSD